MAFPMHWWRDLQVDGRRLCFLCSRQYVRRKQRLLQQQQLMSSEQSHLAPSSSSSSSSVPHSLGGVAIASVSTALVYPVSPAPASMPVTASLSRAEEYDTALRAFQPHHWHGTAAALGGDSSAKRQRVTSSRGDRSTVAAVQFAGLPVDLWRLILQGLDAVDLLFGVARTCKELRRLVRSAAVWRQVHNHDHRLLHHRASARTPAYVSLCGLNDCDACETVSKHVMPLQVRSIEASPALVSSAGGANVSSFITDALSSAVEPASKGTGSRFRLHHGVLPLQRYSHFNR